MRRLRTIPSVGIALCLAGVLVPVLEAYFAEAKTDYRSYKAATSLVIPHFALLESVGASLIVFSFVSRRR